MREYIDKDILLSEARMMWADYHKAYMLIEGKSDKLFYRILLGELLNVELRIIGGWEGIYDVISYAENERFPYILGVVDRDYHEYLNDIAPTKQLIFTESKDIEMMLFNSKSFEKFLEVCGEERKKRKASEQRACVINAAAPTGILRYLSLRNNDCIVFEGIEHKDFIDKKDLSVDYQKLVDKLINRSISKGKRVLSTSEKLLEEMHRILETEERAQYCNGHDVIDVICVAMTKMFASSDANRYDAESVFKYLLMGYTSDEFRNTRLYSSLQSWFELLKS